VTQRGPEQSGPLFVYGGSYRGYESRRASATQRSYLELMRRPDYRRLVAKYSIVPPSDDRSGSETVMRNSIASILVIVSCLSRYRSVVLSNIKLANDGTWEWVGEFLDVGGERIGVVKIPAPVVVVEGDTVDV